MNMKRRTFLGVAATATTTPYFWSSAHAPANDKVTFGAIGTSIYSDRYTGKGDHPGRGAVIGHQAGRIGNMVAVADVNLRHGRFFAERYEGRCKVYQDYRTLLDRKDIQAVTIGTPDHWHSKIAIDAMLAGKDVYCEKPLTLTVDEGKQIIKVLEKTGRVFQVGTQQRSEFKSNFLKAVVLARSGRLGSTLHAVSSVGTGKEGGPFENSSPPSELDWDYWLGQTPKVPFCEKRCNYDFRWWLEYSGGQVTDWGVHHTDIAMWALGMDNSGPQTIEGTGNYPALENGFNVATTFDCSMKFAKGHSIRLVSGPNELVISGNKGSVKVNRNLYEPSEGLVGPDDYEWMEQEIIKLCKGKRPGNHMRNFVECVKDRGEPISDVRSHHRSVSVCHLANIGMQLKRKLTWDSSKEDFVSDEEASSMLSRPQRKKYAIEV